MGELFCFFLGGGAGGMKSSEGFEDSICLVGPAVNTKNKNFRNAIVVKERLAITLTICS